jgi:hypothetical protein
MSRNIIFVLMYHFHKLVDLVCFTVEFECIYGVINSCPALCYMYFPIL